MVLLKKTPPKGKRLLILATSSSRMVMEQMGLIDSFDSVIATLKKNYTIYPQLKKPINQNTSQTPAIIPGSSHNFTAGKPWYMDRFKVWSGGTEGSVEFPRFSGQSQTNTHQSWISNGQSYRENMNEYARKHSIVSVGDSSRLLPKRKRHSVRK